VHLRRMPGSNQGGGPGQKSKTRRHLSDESAHPKRNPQKTLASYEKCTVAGIRDTRSRTAQASSTVSSATGSPREKDGLE
jgi:hypothetical protein